MAAGEPGNRATRDRLPGANPRPPTAGLASLSMWVFSPSVSSFVTGTIIIATSKGS